MNDFKEYALDHINEFDAVPCAFEEIQDDGSDGRVYDAEECWIMAERLGIVKNISNKPNTEQE